MAAVLNTMLGVSMYEGVRSRCCCERGMMSVRGTYPLQQLSRIGVHWLFAAVAVKQQICVCFVGVHGALLVHQFCTACVCLPGVDADMARTFLWLLLAGGMNW